jgi:hypothetical protein
MRFPQRNARFEHAFVVLRCWIGESGGQQDVTLTKAFWTEAEADAEAARLNAENSDGWKDEVQVARLVPRDSG